MFERVSSFTFVLSECSNGRAHSRHFFPRNLYDRFTRLRVISDRFYLPINNTVLPSLAACFIGSTTPSIEENDRRIVLRIPGRAQGKILYKGYNEH